MEGVARVRRPGQEPSARPGRSHRKYEKVSSEGNPSSGEKGADWHPCERRTKITETAEGSQGKEASAGQSRLARRSRHNGCRGPGGSLRSGHREDGHPEGKVRGRPSPTAERRGKSACTRAGPQDRQECARPAPQLSHRRSRPRSPAKPRARAGRQDSPERRPASPKRRRRLSPGARQPPQGLMPGLFNQVGAMQVVLDELRAPGGAFLPAPTAGTEPQAWQRAWLSWQLAHAGANLQAALALLDSLLGPQPVLPSQPPCSPGAPWP